MTFDVLDVLIGALIAGAIAIGVMLVRDVTYYRAQIAIAAQCQATGVFVVKGVGYKCNPIVTEDKRVKLKGPNKGENK